MEKLSVAPDISNSFDKFLETDGSKLIWAIIHRFGGAFIDKEDAFQELSIALWKAYLAYTPDKKTKISTFVYQSVYNQMKMVLRAASTEKRIVDRQHGSVDDQRNLPSHINVEAECIDRLITESRVNALHWAIKTALTSSEQFVIQRTLEDCSQSEIAKEMNVSQSHVSNLKGSAIKKIRECLLSAHWDGDGIQNCLMGESISRG